MENLNERKVWKTNAKECNVNWKTNAKELTSKKKIDINRELIRKPT